MAEVNLHSSEISQASEGLQLNSTAAKWEYIHARLARLETRLVEHNRGPRPNQQVPTYGLVSAYDPELYRHQFNPPAAPQPPYTYMDSYALLRSPYDGPQNPPLPPYKPERDQLYHGHQPIDYQQPPLTAGAAANLPHQNYQPVGQQRCTRKPPLDWPQPPPQHSPSCWCPPTATPLPTAAVPISTPANGFVEIQHLPRPPQHAQFQIFTEPISDSSDVEMPITEEVRTEELPPNELITKFLFNKKIFIHKWRVVHGYYILALVSTLAIAFISKIIKSKPKLPPGPKRWPMIGNLNLLGSLPLRPTLARKA
ncbi:hypothetical protein SASPL_150336 [Salvia splendens]|uniref:Uncharacterized protein n=1 Tax=Salvia splendens TaxID=180675 RepID=A0A8X8W6E5_SALSN|nr:hypothetical protein SASPL_150336 [Salvia splendens]